MTDATVLKIELILVATPGMIAPAATATKPAMSAYSIKSWPRVPAHHNAVFVDDDYLPPAKFFSSVFQV